MKNNYVPFFLIFIMVVFLPNSCLWASSPVVLETTKAQYPLGLHLEYFEDPSRILRIEDVSTPEFATKFTPSQQEILDFGITTSAYWIRFELQAPVHQQGHWLIEIKGENWQLVQFYTKTDNGTWLRKEGGKRLPYDPTMFMHKNAVFHLPTPLPQALTVYVRVETDSELQLNGHLWSLNAYQSQFVRQLYWRGLYHGLLIIMVVYNLFLFLAIRDKSYLFYTLYISAMIVFFMLDDWVGIPVYWHLSLSTLIKIMGSLGAGVFIHFFVLFVKSFLRTSENTPTMDKVLSLLMAVNIVGNFLFAIVGHEGWVVSIIAPNMFLVFTTVLVVAILCIKKGYTPAKFFLLASTTFMGSAAITSLIAAGLLPGSVDTGIFFMKLGVLLEAVLYSFALADRLKYERRQKEKSQQQAIKNLQKADQIKDEFLANTSHELRTPLNGIIGLAEATVHDLEHRSVEAIHSNLSLIIASGRRLSLLVNDILDFSKLKHKSIHLNQRPIVLHRVVESVLILSQTSLRHKPIQLINQVDPRMPAVLADEARLEQILFNLISNAIKFTHEGSITISAQTHDDHVMISVADTGIGIPKEKQAQIFNAFEQIDGTETRLYEGTGLGLTVVKQLVDLHQSQLTLKSEVHEGSVFSFSLPMAPQGQPSEHSLSRNLPDSGSELPKAIESRNTEFPEPPLSEANYPTEMTSSNNRPNPFHLKGFLDILVVDDDPLNLEVICQQLTSHHYTLHIAQNGSEAIQWVDQRHQEGRPPDLILLDVMMPEISGFEVCLHLRQHHHQNQLPIIFLTAKNREADVIRGLEIGGNDYLTKPFFRSELIQRVETQLEITLYQKQSDTLKAFANKISHYASQQEMMHDAFEQITHWSFVDEAALFQGDELLFHRTLGEAAPTPFKRPPQSLLKKLNSGRPSASQIVTMVNAAGPDHPVGQFYQPGHFLFVSPQHLPDHLFVFYRNLERIPFDESKAASYVQSMISQIQTTQNNLETLFEDNKLVAVVGQVQPRLSEITHIKATSPTLELHFDSDKRPEYIDGCSLEKLDLYFKESLLIRNHKSYLVNPTKMVALHKTSKSRLLKIELTSGEIIPVGRTYVEKIRHDFAELLL